MYINIHVFKDQTQPVKKLNFTLITIKAERKLDFQFRFY